MNDSLIQIAIVDDHTLFAVTLRDFLNSQPNLEVVFVSNSATDFFYKIKDVSTMPSVILVDINMPKCDGIELTSMIKKEYPALRILAVSMACEEGTVVKALKAGVNGYILKDSHPEVLIQAIETVFKGEFYSNEISTLSMLNNINKEELKLNNNEKKLLELVCTELTYKEIADVMCLSPKTIDGYREMLFQKLGVHSRIGLAMYSIRNKYYSLD
ncbi:MAG: response regulator transcription factor [Bacteroidia bacterium]